MDRGKAKMTADDIAAEHRAKKRKSQMSSGETLRLQPSREIPENEMYDTMLQQQLDTGYMPAPENAWCVNPWIVRVSAPMPISLAPQMFGNPCIIPASAPIPLQSTPQTTTNFPTTIPMPPQIVQGQMFNSPCTVPASAPVPLQSAPKTTTNLPTTIPSPPQIVQGQMQMSGSPCTIPASTPVPLQSAPQTTTTFSTTVATPPQIVQDQFFDIEPEVVNELYRIIDDAELMNISQLHKCIKSCKTVIAVVKASLERTVNGAPLYVCSVCDSICKNSNGVYVCSFCGVYCTQIPKKISRIELFDSTGKLLVHVHPDYMKYLEKIFKNDPIMFRISIQDWEGTSIAFVANFVKSEIKFASTFEKEKQLINSFINMFRIIKDQVEKEEIGSISCYTPEEEEGSKGGMFSY